MAPFPQSTQPQRSYRMNPYGGTLPPQPGMPANYYAPAGKLGRERQRMRTVAIGVRRRKDPRIKPIVAAAMTTMTKRREFWASVPAGSNGNGRLRPVLVNPQQPRELPDLKWRVPAI